jgi:uncharacterized integral membrane protein (TIGR00697 family)
MADRDEYYIFNASACLSAAIKHCQLLIMIHNILKDKATRLFIIMGGFFIANALVAEFMGVKIFSLEETLGWKPVRIPLFGSEYSFNLTCGVLLWPFVFVMTDIINEYYGKKGVRFISWMAVALIAYGFFMLFGAMNTAPNAWWITSKQTAGIENMNTAYNSIFGQGLGIIIASMIAFLIGQLVDVLVFHGIKKKTGEKHIWLRATGSTLVSQLIDSFVVLVIAFYLFPMWVSGQGSPWPLDQVLAIGIVNYIYKFIIAVLLTPVIYFIHHRIEKYLGHDAAAEMKKAAMEG